MDLEENVDVFYWFKSVHLCRPGVWVSLVFFNLSPKVNLPPNSQVSPDNLLFLYRVMAELCGIKRNISSEINIWSHEVQIWPKSWKTKQSHQPRRVNGALWTNMWYSSSFSKLCTPWEPLQVIYLYIDIFTTFITEIKSVLCMWRT